MYIGIGTVVLILVILLIIFWCADRERWTGPVDLVGVAGQLLVVHQIEVLDGFSEGRS